MYVPTLIEKRLRGGGRRKQATVRKPMRSRLALVDRQLLSTLTVTSAASDGPGTLRQTIAVAERKIQSRSARTSVDPSASPAASCRSPGA